MVFIFLAKLLSYLFLLDKNSYARCFDIYKWKIIIFGRWEILQCYILLKYTDVYCNFSPLLKINSYLFLFYKYEIPKIFTKYIHFKKHKLGQIKIQIWKNDNC